MNERYSVPAKLNPAYFPYLWGGTLLRDCLKKEIPSEDIGESWEVSTHPKGQSILISGPAKGMKLGDYAVGCDFYGSKVFEKFPLLIKFLGPQDNLSVQVHPSDTNCRPGEAGKSEAWVVVDCPEGAELIYDINCSKEEFAALVAGGRIVDGLCRVQVSPGDVLDIPAGKVHALMQGIVVYEVQQNSDTTYRLYDWGRVDAAGKPRELHIEAALNVIERGVATTDTEFRFRWGEGFSKSLLVHNNIFTLEKIEINGIYQDAWFNCFASYSVVKGEGSVLKNGEKLFDVALGDSFISPAAAGAVELQGNLTVLMAHVPPADELIRSYQLL